MQGDADRDLGDYPDGAFDYAILSQTLQATNRPKQVLTELLRIGQKAIVSFPNFGHWRARFDLMFRGRMPQNPNLPIMWYETPNIHFVPSGILSPFVMNAALKSNGRWC